MRFLIFPQLFASLVIVVSISACTGVHIFGDADIKLSEVSIVSISQDASTTIVIVDVVRGDNPLEFVGISYSENEGASIMENQSQYALDGSGTYEIPLEGLSPERTYYFRAFIGEEIFMVESEAASFFAPRPAAPDLPCTLTLNVIKDRGITYENANARVDGGYGGHGAYGFTIENGIGAPRISANFNSVPTSGIYTSSTFSLLDDSPRHVLIYYRAGFLETTIDAGQDVFVEKVDEGHYIVSFCSMSYSFPNSTTEWSFSGQVEVD